MTSRCIILYKFMPKKVKLLRIREAAELLGVNLETLRRWDREGNIKAIRIGLRGHRMYV